MTGVVVRCLLSDSLTTFRELLLVPSSGLRPIPTRLLLTVRPQKGGFPKRMDNFRIIVIIDGATVLEGPEHVRRFFGGTEWKARC